MKATTMKTPALWKKGTGMIIRQLNKVLCSLLAATLTVTSVSAVAGETIRYVHTDHLGTPIVWTDENGNIIKTREYEPYGLQVSGAVEDGPGYTGHVEDAATGLTYMQQRYYDPGIGMFLSVDPVTAYSSPVGQFNRYRYANGNPYLYTDPDGGIALVALAGIATVLIVAAVMSTPQGKEATSQMISKGMENLKGNIEFVEGLVLNESTESPDVPSGLVGEQDGKGGPKKGRHNSGPLSTENGGTGNADEDFETLTGGRNSPAPEDSDLPEGSRVGENGIVLRPSENGPRIDIPDNGDKPRETLHYPREN